MEHPVKEIPQIIASLTVGSPHEQRLALETYFTPNAAFTHPLCRVPSFNDVSIPLIGEINSRWVLWMVYRWYKILSPKIVLDVHGSVLDQKQGLLYVNISQVFHIFLVPFYKSHVSLVTVLTLVHDENSKKYYIAKQEDHYQLNEFVKFFWPGGATFFYLWQLFATFVCIVGGLLGIPLTLFEEKVAEKEEQKKIE